MNTDRYTDHELVARILSGHPDLFGPLIERHIRAAHAIAYARLGNAADAEDAVQDAFLRAYERLTSLRDPAKFGAWLLTIARHEAARIAAKRNHTPTLRDLDSQVASTESTLSTPSTVPDPAQREMNQLLRDHIMRLPESAREVLLLHYFAGHSAREIAVLLSLRRTAVLKRLQRGRDALAETLLRDLETTRPSSESFTKQTARIAALAGAIKLSGTATASSAVAATVGVGISIKVLAASLALVAAGTVAGISAWRSLASPNSSTAQREATPIALDSARQTENSSDETIEATRDTNVNSLASMETSDAEILAKTATTDSKTILPQNLSGTWDVTVVGPEGAIDKATGEVMRQVILDDHMLGIDVFSKSSTSRLIEGTGTVDADRVMFTLRSNDSNNGYSYTDFTIHLEGTHDPAASEIRLSGTSEYRKVASAGQMVNVAPRYINVPIEMKWRRISDKPLTKAQFARVRSKELQELSRAIFNYAYKNQGLPPSSLEQLVPTFLPSFRPYNPEAGVTLTYTPPVRLPHMPNVNQSYGIDAKTGLKIENGRPRQDRMMEVERDLTREWGDQFITVRPMAEAVYDRFNLVLVITQNGEVGSPEAVGCQPLEHTEAPTGEQQKALIESCQNNMKQLGLSLKMFSNEDREERYPAGWRMIYPEYLPDRCILLCPGANLNEIAYEIVFPAVNDAELEATFDRLFGDIADRDEPGSRARKQSRIPVVIELQECSHSGGRNVLFLDGHTEHIKGSLESDPKLAPFLNLH